MAVETQERAPGATAPRSGMLGYKTGRERPAGGFELWSWLFMRISGIVLLFLAVGHVLIMHVVDEGVNRVDFAFVQDR
jgi:succinate dehydrogenase / fumarate reductase, membrane anchor subunit